jgi:hypothetical protein
MFVIKYSKFWFIGIFYKAVMHKNIFGQAYSIDLLNMILKKFILYFADTYYIFYKF